MVHVQAGVRKLWPLRGFQSNPLDGILDQQRNVRVESGLPLDNGVPNCQHNGCITTEPDNVGKLKKIDR